MVGAFLERRTTEQLAEQVRRQRLGVVRGKAPALSPIALRAMRSTRFVISEAAWRENVISRMRRGSAPLTIRCATRWASVLVLPDPAPAMTSSGPKGPGPAAPCSTARRCSGLRLSGTRLPAARGRASL
jgi:hypothetical protein